MKRVFIVHRNSPRASAVRFRTQGEASRFLTTAAGNPENTQHFRNLFHRERSGSSRATDQEVIGFLASRLVQGDLRLEGVRQSSNRGTALGSASGGEEEEQYEPPPPRPPAPKPREEPLLIRPRPEPASAIASPPTPKMDIEKQIAALKAAAKDGTPFCEQCERNRLAREAG